ncbi:MAG TPA: hypothetical protein VNT60_10285 [Deinococcales bacterium]|nr:hypothetical protein [Deinococcales bacterium]
MISTPAAWLEGEPGQRGVAGLLAGERRALKPEGFDDAHRRLPDEEPELVLDY